jgi:cytochrome c-type biogenesis protein CcmH
MKKLKWCFSGFLIVCVMSLSAQMGIYDFENQEQASRFEKLTHEIRCPKCQNQSIADSDAPIATDLRAKVYQWVLDGQTDEVIIKSLIDRYGDFVTYNPPVKGAAIFLWLMPLGLFLLLAGGFFILIRKSHQQSILEKKEREFE